MASVQILSDSASLQALIAEMPPIQQEQYNDYRCLEMESSFPGRRLIVFDLHDDEPRNIEEIYITDFFYTRGASPEAEYRFQHDGRFKLARIGVVPTRFAHREVFLSIPQRFEFRWGGRTVDGQVSFRPHFGLLIKTRHKLVHRVEGATYCVSLKRFQAEFPRHVDQVRY